MLKNKFLSLFLTLSIVGFTSSCASDDIATLPEETQTTQQMSISAYESGVESSILKIFNSNDDAAITENASEMFTKGFQDITVSDIQQGKRPICYFLAAVGGLAYQRPSDVPKLMHENPDGTYMVSFPGLAKDKRNIVVTKPTEEEMSYFIHKGKNGSIWVPILAKAIAKHWSKNGFFRFFKSNTEAANWGGGWEGIEVVTGHVADFMLVSINTTDRILTKTGDALANKKLVSVSTFGKGNVNPKNVGEIKFSKAHVMTLLSVDKTAKTFTIRDPYGTVKKLTADGSIYEDPSTDGVFTLKAEEFRKYFNDIAIETNTNSNFISRMRYLK